MTDRELIESWGFETSEEEIPFGVTGSLTRQVYFTAKDKLGHLPLCTSRAGWATHPKHAAVIEDMEREMAWKAIKRAILKELCK